MSDLVGNPEDQFSHNEAHTPKESVLAYLNDPKFSDRLVRAISASKSSLIRVFTISTHYSRVEPNNLNSRENNHVFLTILFFGELEALTVIVLLL